MATAARKHRTRKKGRDLFLRALAETGNVGLSVEASGVGRSTVYEWRDKDEGFAQEWDNALDAASDVLEAEARRRAAEGTQEPVFYQGEEIGSVRKYSDLLLIFLLKAVNRHRFDPDGYVKLSLHEKLIGKQRELEVRLDRVQASLPTQPEHNPERQSG